MQNGKFWLVVIEETSRMISILSMKEFLSGDMVKKLIYVIKFILIVNT